MLKILYAGRVAPIKDIPTLEKAAKIIGAELIINCAYSYNEIPNLFRSADIIVVPTLSKALDKVFIEALACGVPALGTDLGYPFMADKFPQLVFRAGDSHDLAQKIKWLAANPEQTKMIVLKAKSFVRESFDLDKLMDRIVTSFISDKV